MRNDRWLRGEDLSGNSFSDLFCISGRSFVAQNKEKVKRKRKARQAGQKIAYRKDRFDSANAEEVRKNEDTRNEVQTLTQAGKKRCLKAFANRLEGHVTHDVNGKQGEHEGFQPQGIGADGDNFRVIDEKRHELWREDIKRDRKDEHDRGTEDPGERVCGLHAVPFLGAEVIAEDRLVTLADTEEYTEDQHDDLGKDAHRGQRSIVGKISGLLVQKDRGDTGKTLTQKGRKSRKPDIAVERQVFGKVSDAEFGDVLLQKNRDQKKTEGYALGDQGGDRSTCDTEIQNVDHERVKEDIEDTAETDTDHGEEGFSFPSPEVVEYVGAHHDRGTEKNICGVGLCIRKCSLCGAEHVHDRFDKDKTQDRDQRSDAECREKTGGEGAVGGLLIFRTERTGKDTSGAHAERKADGLDEGHERKNNTDGGGLALPELGYEIGICRIINSGHEHTDRRWNCQL